MQTFIFSVAPVSFSTRIDLRLGKSFLAVLCAFNSQLPVDLCLMFRPVAVPFLHISQIFAII